MTSPNPPGSAPAGWGMAPASRRPRSPQATSPSPYMPFPGAPVAHHPVVPDPHRRGRPRPRGWPPPPSAPPAQSRRHARLLRSAWGHEQGDVIDGPGALNDLLIELLDRGGSDLHITTGARPTLRISGHLIPMDEYPEFTPPVIQRMLYADHHPEAAGEVRGGLGARLRLRGAGQGPVPGQHLPPARCHGRGLPGDPLRDQAARGPRHAPRRSPTSRCSRAASSLVTGPTGSGKSTTLAAIVDLANRSRADHIMTVEDPIEFLHHHRKCLVNQREVGEDTHSFANALKHVLRQDPDIILVGEMRDLETISVALTAAETGHLVFATLHTQDAAQTIDRVIDVFPAHQQQQVRVQLAGALQAVVCQTLVRTADGKGRVAAIEVLVATPAIRNLIREGKTHQIGSAPAGRREARNDQHGPVPWPNSSGSARSPTSRASRSATTSRTTTGCAVDDASPDL